MLPADVQQNRVSGVHLDGDDDDRNQHIGRWTVRWQDIGLDAWTESEISERSGDSVAEDAENEGSDDRLCERQQATVAISCARKYRHQTDVTLAQQTSRQMNKLIFFYLF